MGCLPRFHAAAWVEGDEQRAEKYQRRHRKFKHLGIKFEQQHRSQDSATHADGDVGGGTPTLPFEFHARAEHAAEAGAHDPHGVGCVRQHRRDATCQQRRV